MPLFDYFSLFPGSDFAHVLHHARLGAKILYPTETVRTVGVTSNKRRAGTSTIAANLASVYAQAASGRVLLVDANPYMPSLSKSLAPNAAAGLIDAIEGSVTLKRWRIRILSGTSTSCPWQRTRGWTIRWAA